MSFGSQRRAWRRSGSLPVVGVLVATLVGIFFLLRPRAAIVHETIDVDGMRREYRLVVPHAIAGRRDVPVVFALHGAIDTVDEMAAYTELDELAIEKEFLLVYLQGRMLSWPPFIPLENPTLMEPDAAFLRAMCDRMTDEHGGDPRRIYLLGVSQGGAAANLLTAMCSERIAATVVGCGWRNRWATRRWRRRISARCCSSSAHAIGKCRRRWCARGTMRSSTRGTRWSFG